MYRYDEFDHQLVKERVEQFRGQIARRLSGALKEEEFKPLRLMNGLYLQLHAYMLRVAIPYGILSSRQLRMLAQIARVYDKGFGHFTTRQNIQFNWPRLEDVADILTDLASVEMHCIQTSGNCIRNVTSDQYAGASADEIADPRVYCEIIRQWSSLHPEFSFLPRKFKIALTGAPNDRAAVRVHDIGLMVCRNQDAEIGFTVMVGGGLGRTPRIGDTIRDFLPERHLLSYLEAILRVYNQLGRRDNIYKARIKILVAAVGAEKFAALVEEEWETIRDGALSLPQTEIDRINAYFAPPTFEALQDSVADQVLADAQAQNSDFARWVTVNVAPHKIPGYAIVNISLKPEGRPPGDATAEQMEAIADLAKIYSFDEIRVTHEQNLVLPHVKKSDLATIWQRLVDHDLATANLNLISDMICCPGMDYCALATARSIPIAARISERFADIDRQRGIGELRLKISGCINACGHHHVGGIGLLGVDRRGEEYYQITLGGSARDDAAIGKIIGPAFPADMVVDAVETIIEIYLDLRQKDETFLETYRRVGVAPFKEKLYAAH